MSSLGKRFRIPLTIYATDYVAECVNKCQRKIEEFGLDEIITASTKNVYTTEFIEEKYHIVYTSAVVEPLFSLKILYLALQCKTVQYLLWNHGHCEDVLKISNAENNQSFQQLVRNRLTLVDARLEKDSGQTEDSELQARWIYALELNKYVHSLHIFFKDYTLHYIMYIVIHIIYMISK